MSNNIRDSEIRWKGKTSDELLVQLYNVEHMSKAADQIRQAIYIKMLEDHSEKIRKSTEASDRLANRIVWLNVVLGFFSGVGVVYTVAQFYK